MANKLLIGVVVLVVIVIGAFMFISAPPSTANTNYQEEVSLESRNANTALYGSLTSMGIIDMMTDVQVEQTYVAYELPSGFDSEATQKAVFGAAGRAAAGADSKMIAVAQYQNDQPKFIWKVATSDFDAWVKGELKEDEFNAKIQKTNA